MNLDACSLALSHITHLVTGLTKKNFKASTSECRLLVQQFGLEVERHLHKTLFSQVDFAHEAKNSLSSQHQFLIQLCEVICRRPNFVSLLCFAVDNPLSHQKTLRPSALLLGFLAKNLKLSPLRELAFALALTSSVQQELRRHAEAHFRLRLTELLGSSDIKQSLSEAETSPEVAHFILSGVLQLQGGEHQELKRKFVKLLRNIFVKETPSILQPLLVDPAAFDPTSVLLSDHREDPLSSMMASPSLPEIIRDLGYQFTAKPEVCRSHLMRLCGADTLHAATVARVVGVMIRTHTGLDDSATLQNMNATGTSLWDKDKSEPKTWNVEVFIKVVHELQPTLHWKEIVLELDHIGFVVKDRQGLILLIKALKLGFQVQGLPGPFPVDMFYRPWKNSEGQVSLFQQILRNPDIFNFAEHQHHPVAVELMKVPPDIDNREIASWRSLELLDTLLVLAESGHAMSVLEMLQLPKTHCPDVLTLGLIQINPPLTSFRSEALAQLLQIFLSNHPNSGVILNYAWHSNLNLKVVVVHAMADWYSKAAGEGDSEHNRLSRILDVAQDLKALSLLLSAKPGHFVIDLAVMASRREYLNLDKWLGDQVREHGEIFIKTAVQYLHRKLPPLSGASAVPLKEEHFAKANFPIDALPVMLLCLQGVAQQAPIQPELKEAIFSMVQVSQQLLSRPRQPQPQQPTGVQQQQQPPPPPPGSMRNAPRTLDLVGVGGGPQQQQGFAPPPVRPTPRPGLPSLYQQQQSTGGASSQQESLLGMTSQFGTLNFGGSGGNSNGSASAFSIPGALGQLVSGPGSPSRVFGGGPLPPPPSSGEVGGGGSPSPFGFPPSSMSTSSAVSSTTSSSVVGSGGGGGGGMQTGIEQIRQGNISQIFPDITAPIPREVEDEANSYFQRIYNHPPHPTLSINEVLDLLKKFQESTSQRERDVFNCMIKNLFEEYKYFPQYPEKELHITAQLFGGIIEHGLVNMVPLGLALRFVLDAVRKPADSNMYYFGVTALDRFKTRLKDYPQYCQHITCIDHFKEFPPHLIKWVEYGVQSQVPPGDPPKGDVLPEHLRAIIENQTIGATASGSPGGAAVGAGNIVSMGSLVPGVNAPITAAAGSQLQVTKTTTTVTNTTSVSHTIVRPTAITVAGRPSIANTTNIDTLLNAKQKSGGGEPMKVPSDKVQDKVAFIFNNLSLMNMQQKGDDLKEVLSDEYTCWLAQYLVMKRASIEPNFHTLYSSFLEVMGNPQLYKEVLKETYNNIRILLGSDKSIANFSDRSLLKNLGHWLGLMTLARNKPILMLDLEIKPLIIEAYHNGQQELLYVVPFVAKVLESCAKSKVFKPPCPWTEGIMNLLAELHQEHDLKLNLKFEIEVLCKNLSIELTHLRPGTLLKDYDKLNRMLNFKSFGLKQPGVSGMVNASHMMHPVGGKGGNDANSAIENFVSMNQAHLSRGGTGMVGGRQQLDHLSAGGMISNSMNANAAAGAMGIDISSSVGSNAMSMSGGGMQMMPFGPPGGSLTGAGMGLTQPSGLSTSVGLIPPSSLGLGGHIASGGAEQALSGGNELMMHPPQQQQLGLPNAAGGALRPTEPKFHFTDINTSNLNGIVPHIQIDNRLTLLKDQPDLIQLVKIAIEKSIQEWVAPVIDRSIKIALTTCEQIVKKDFALDQDEGRMRASSHNMVRNLTAGMAMITCRDHLLLSIKNNLKNLMVTLTRNLTQQQTEAIEMTVSVIANDNVELACAFIQKKAIEKAIPEIDKRLKSEFENRMYARKENRHHLDAVALTYQAERMPEAIRLKVGSVTAQQSAVYDEFARNIPGFKPLTEREAALIAPKPAAIEAAAPLTPQQTAAPAPVAGTSAGLSTSDECIAILDEVISKVDPFVQNCTGLPAAPHMSNLHAILDGMTRARNTKEPAAIMVLVEKAVENLLQGLTVQQAQVDAESLARYRDANLLVLRAISDPRAYGPGWTNSRVTQALVETREEIRYNLDAFDCLIRSNLINLFEYDKFLAAAMANGDNVVATNFAMHVCKMYLMDDRTNAQVIESDLFGTIEILQKIATQHPHPPDGISNLMEMIKMSSERLEQNLAMAGPTAQLHSGIQQAREFEDPPGLLEKTEFLLREWVNAYHSRDAGKDSRQAFIVFVQLMNQHGILKTDDLITRFFRMSTQMCVDLCYRALSEQNNAPTLVRAKCFHTLDAYVRLITLLVKHSGETQNTITKVNLLNKVLGIVAGVLLIDHDVRNTDFQQVPYHRIFIMLFLELNSPDQILENINFQVLTAYCNMLHILRPAKAPGFAYAWLEVVSHRVFMGRILASTAAQKGWPMYAQLLVDLFKFLSPFLRNAELAKPVHRLYRGTLRVLLVLLHDFPEFLCDYHYGFCDVIPPNCIQMRNLILSAFPRNMRLPDPFTPNLKVEMLPEISIAPRTVSNYAAMIKPSFKKDLDSYLKNRSPVSFLSEVRDNLLMAAAAEPQQQSQQPPGNRYNIQLINALVMHVGTSAIQFIRAKGLTPNMSTIAHSSHMDIFQNLAVDLETEGRYLFLNCIANQLRYPNSHTHYFSCTLLYLFAEANTEAIQEQITRVLLERLIVNRPHPWGLLITFIELIKNPTFNFWQHEFVTCAPEIQKLFESVARSCMVHTMPMRAAAAAGNAAGPAAIAGLGDQQQQE